MNLNKRPWRWIFPMRGATAYEWQWGRPSKWSVVMRVLRTKVWCRRNALRLVTFRRYYGNEPV